jgi:hypothetical protein
MDGIKKCSNGDEVKNINVNYNEGGFGRKFAQGAGGCAGNVVGCFIGIIIVLVIIAILFAF